MATCRIVLLNDSAGGQVIQIGGNTFQDADDPSTIKSHIFSLRIRVEPHVDNNALTPFHPSEPVDATAQNLRLLRQSAAHFQGAIDLTEPTAPSRHVFGFGTVENLVHTAWAQVRRGGDPPNGQP